jgi:hypothetical protein
MMEHVYEYAYVGFSYKCEMFFSERIWSTQITTCLAEEVPMLLWRYEYMS